jgi:WD40 repeat protein
MRFCSFNHRSFCSLAIVTFAAATAATCAAAEEPSPPAPAAVSFSREVAPLLLKHCLACHNPRKAEGGYRVDCYAVVAAAGDSGLSPLQAEGDDSAELIRRICSNDESERMPAETTPLDEATIAVFTRWIDAGGSFDGSDETLPLAQLIPPPTHPASPEVYPAALPVTAVAFSADGKEIYSSGYHELLVAGDAPHSVTSIPIRLDDVVLDSAFSPDGKLLVCGSADKAVRFVDLSSGEVATVLQSHAEQVTAVAFCTDGSKMATASRDGSSKVFDTATGQLLVSYQGHAGPVRGVAMPGDGTQVFSSGDDKKLHRWNVADAKKTAEIALGGEGFGIVASPDALWATSADGQLRRVALADNAVQVFTGHTDWALCTALSRDGTYAVTGSHNGEVRLWNTSDASTIVAWQARP